MNLGQQL